MNKVKFGNKSMLYPYPATILSLEVEGKLNYMQVGFTGIVNANPGMIAMGIGKGHHTTKGLSKGKILSVNLANEKMMVKADYVGIKSGKTTDKSSIFETFRGDNGAIIIKESPVSLECKILEILDIGGLDNIVIMEILESYVDEDVVSGNFPDIEKIKPLMLSMYENRYFGIGDYLGKAWNVGLEHDKKVDN